MMEFFVLIFGIAIVFTIVEYQIQGLKDAIKESKQEIAKSKYYKREHANISKTNFRKYFKRSNRCICKIQK